MSSTHTTLCIVNTSGIDITNIEVSEVDNYDWGGNSRPDRNFQGITLPNNNSPGEREELNNWSNSAWYRMTLTFSDGTNLTFRNDQKDAKTKFNRSLDAGGSATDKLTLYQTSGGGTNAIYIREKQAPDNSRWMGELLTKKPDVKLNAITMPGSHDAGMNLTHDCTVGVQPEWARTQVYSINDQLKAGSRYFDLRVYYKESNYFIGHFDSVPVIGNSGCYGSPLATVLAQVKNFVQSDTGKSETVILKFSHTMDSSPEGYSVREVTKYVIDEVKSIFESYLYTSSNTQANLGEILLSQLSGKVVAVFDKEYEDDVKNGIFPDRYAKVKEYGLRVYDQYSGTGSYSEMSEDQQKKLTDKGGYGNDYLFLLSWTLTGKLGSLDIQVLSTLANPWLPQILTKIKKEELKPANIIYYDFVDAYINRAIIDLNYWRS